MWCRRYIYLFYLLQISIATTKEWLNRKNKSFIFWVKWTGIPHDILQVKSLRSKLFLHQLEDLTDKLKNHTPKSVCMRSQAIAGNLLIDVVVRCVFIQNLNTIIITIFTWLMKNTIYNYLDMFFKLFLLFFHFFPTISSNNCRSKIRILATSIYTNQNPWLINNNGCGQLQNMFLWAG